MLTFANWVWDVGKAKIPRHFRLQADFGFLADMP
jgi:hypothetical protein